jgi:tetratricopeptide (TPR) repeat protein
MVGVWEASSGKPLASFKGHALGEKITFGPDGSRITAAGDRTVRVWDATTYECLMILTANDSLTPTDAYIESVALTRDGTRIASGWSDETVRIWDSRSAYHPEAEKLVSSLFRQFTFASDVIRHLQTVTTLDADLRKAALQLVQARGDSPAWFNTESWAIAKSPDGSLEAYQRALKMAEVASRLVPWNASYLNTLGIVQYRIGAYKDALATLTRCASLRENPAAADLVFIAMAHSKLGAADKARAELEQLRALMKDPRRSSSAELQGFLREAESLIR